MTSRLTLQLLCEQDWMISHRKKTCRQCLHSSLGIVYACSATTITMINGLAVLEEMETSADKMIVIYRPPWATKNVNGNES